MRNRTKLSVVAVMTETTSKRFMLMSQLRVFNPHTHVGCDQSTKICLITSNCFNPRTHVGCDLQDTYLTFVFTCFNPRTHVGCDYYYDDFHQQECVSIHAPT